MIFNVTGGGGTSLNFKVVDGTTAPGSSTENAIWVKTPIDIPYWTTASSATAPAYVAEKGTVTFWWESATSAEVSGTTAAGFMPIKYKATNPPGYMRLKPINCYQNQDGTAAGWKSMDAYIYKSGVWVQFSSEFDGTIFNLGSANEGVTGGWETIGLTHVSGSAYGKAPTISSTGEGVKIASTDNLSGIYKTKNKINLSGYSTIKFTGRLSDYNNYNRSLLAVWSSIGGTTMENIVAKISTYKEDVSELTLDISTLTGEYYIGFTVNNSAYVIAQKVKLE